MRPYICKTNFEEKRHRAMGQVQCVLSTVKNVIDPTQLVVVVVVVYLFTNITSKYTHTEKLKTRLQSTIMSIYR